MTPQEYTQWLQGFLDNTYILSGQTLNAQQTQLIKDKLNTVFNKVTPNLHVSGNFPVCGDNKFISYNSNLYDPRGNPGFPGFNSEYTGYISITC